MTMQSAANYCLWQFARWAVMLTPVTLWSATIQLQRGGVTASRSMMVAGATTPVVADTTTSAVRLELNVPAYRLDVFVRDDPVRSFQVAVGMPNFPTPRGTFSISQVQWNPWWIPPKSAWAKDQKKTPPGPSNPMGKVKLAFRAPYFVHGTPDEGSLGKPSSHGCVRLSNKDAIALATLIQRSVLGAGVSDSVSAIVLPTRRTLAVDLRVGISLRIRYDLAELRTDTLFLYPDPYGLGTSPAADAKSALSRGGRDTTDIDFVRLRRMIQYPRARQAFPLRELLGNASDSSRLAPDQSLAAATTTSGSSESPGCEPTPRGKLNL